MDLSATAHAAAQRLGLPAPRPLPGATGQTWAVGRHILRLVATDRVAVELAAADAAGTVVPVPDVLDRVNLDSLTALVLRRLPGVPAGDLGGLDASAAYRRGQECGRLHAALARVAAPAVVPAARATSGTPLAGTRLLHLDLHPFNVLVDAGGTVTGVLDWANTAAGDGALDRARTWSILVGDPTARQLAADPVAAALFRGWAETGGFAELPPPATDWATAFLVDDLAHRHSAAVLDASVEALRRSRVSSGRAG